jgi:hypothetical protein
MITDKKVVSLLHVFRAASVALSKVGTLEKVVLLDSIGRVWLLAVLSSSADL